MVLRLMPPFLKPSTGEGDGAFYTWKPAGGKGHAYEKGRRAECATAFLQCP
jgi:hypothetical protein